MMISPEEQEQAALKARENLMRVMRAVGAHFTDGRVVMPDVMQRVTYWIDANHITRFPAIRSTSVADPAGLNGTQSTCYQSFIQTPADEKIAGIMLQLKNCPELFDLLRSNHGVWFGGK